MSSSLLEKMGISSFDPAYLCIAILILLVLVIVLLVLNILQGKKLKKYGIRLTALCSGSDGESLEDEIRAIIADNGYLMDAVSDHKAKIKTINRRMTRVYQKIGLVKYDALHQMGGQFSFVLCMLDEYDNGFILNSVQTGEGCYTYCKAITEGISDIELGKEEQEALIMAIDSNTVK